MGHSTRIPDASSSQVCGHICLNLNTESWSVAATIHGWKEPRLMLLSLSYVSGDLFGRLKPQQGPADAFYLRHGDHPSWAGDSFSSHKKLPSGKFCGGTCLALPDHAELLFAFRGPAGQGRIGHGEARPG
jgi:hypothetical protein